MEIQLTQGKTAIVDDADFDLIKDYKWFAYCDRNVNRNNWYAATGIRIFSGKGGRRKLRMHHLILKPKKGMTVDHINRNGLDNRRCNLRCATLSQNIANGRHRENREYRGVYEQKVKRLSSLPFYAAVRHNGKLRYLGSFKTAREAALAYDAAASKLHNRFATLNFKEGEKV